MNCPFPVSLRVLSLLLVGSLVGGCASTGGGGASTANARVAAAKAEGRPVRVACIGDSIVNGHLIDDRDAHFPAVMNRLLGDAYEVRGYGRNGASAYQESGRPYHLERKWGWAQDWDPDIYVVLLGTNDSYQMGGDSPMTKEVFVDHYGQLLDTMAARGAQIYLCTPPKVVNTRIIYAIEDIARARGLPVIQLRSGIQLGPDRIHPTAEGAAEIARRAVAAIRRG